MPDLLHRLPLGNEVKAALLHRTGCYGEVFREVEHYQRRKFGRPKPLVEPTIHEAAPPQRQLGTRDPAGIGRRQMAAADQGGARKESGSLFRGPARRLPDNQLGSCSTPIVSSSNTWLSKSWKYNAVSDLAS